MGNPNTRKQENLGDFLLTVDAKKQVLDNLRPLPSHSAQSLRAKISLDWTYNSNAIEGNTLTLRETKVVVEDGITIGGKSLREHSEAVNHHEAIQYVEELVNSNEPISEWLIKNIHQLVLKGIDQNNAGRYRNENVVISGAGFNPPDFLYLPERMNDLMLWHSGPGKYLHPIERAAHLHAKFVEIHPFIDGNGRTGRLLMNLDLMREGYPVAVILKEDRLAYYEALDKACVEQSYDDFTRMLTESVDKSLDLYLEVLVPDRNIQIESDPDVSSFEP